MPFRDDRQAQRARIEALENEVAELREERDRVLADRESEDDDARELLAEAKEERALELENARAAQEARERSRRTHGLTERWIVAWNLRRSLHTFLLVVAGISVLALIGFGTALARPDPILPAEKTAIQLLTLVALVSAIGASTWLARSLLHLRRLRERLPFVLDPAGWASFVDKEHFWLSEMWWHVALGVEGGERAQVEAALERLCERANGTFYGADEPTSDERVRWKRKGRKARGSANRSTAFAIATFCAEDLAPLASGERGVKRVSLTVADDMVHVSRPS